jgi:lipopolysaccharide transport system ATP-binding protein
MSRVTDPTSGRVQLRGRVGSLLEVGTGFHPELTGRENIYMNGSILGMRRREIDRKFDEIVAFSEIDQFLDTPVKRYSSGMYVRLAFAVAAHLEPELLVVDEVLAVGDIGFQRKCLGKMGQVANSGRTILFVSHNMAAIRQLCSHGIFLERGEVTKAGDIKECLDRYYASHAQPQRFNPSRTLIRSKDITIEDVRLFKGLVETDTFTYGDSLDLDITITSARQAQVCVELVLRDNLENALAFFGSGISLGKEFVLQEGANTVRFRLPHLPLAQGVYYFDVAVGITKKAFLAYLESCSRFTIDYSDPGNTGISYIQNGKGSLYVPFSCTSSAREVSNRALDH